VLLTFAADGAAIAPVSKGGRICQGRYNQLRWEMQANFELTWAGQADGNRRLGDMASKLEDQASKLEDQAGRIEKTRATD
jgi:hypothetical protein